MNNRYIFESTSNIVIAAIIIAVSIFYFYFTSGDSVVGMLGDDAAYLLQAELYSPWVNDSSPAIDYIQKRSFYPPIYPIVLGMFGADTHNLILASNLTVSFLLLSFLIIGYFVYVLTESKFTAILIALMVAFLPKSLLFSQDLYSEFLFMCFIYAAFILVNDNEISSEQWLLGALVISLASLTRSIGIGLSCAFIILLIIKRPRYYFYYISLSCMPFLMWMFNRYVLIGDVSYITQMVANSNAISAYDVFSLLQNKIIILIQSWSRLFTSKVDNTIFVTSFLVMFFILSLIGFYSRLIKYKLDAIFIPVYLLLVIIWPFNEFYLLERFIYPVFPVLLIYIIIAIQKLFSQKKYQYISFGVILLFNISIVLPTSISYIKRGFIDIEPNLKPYTRTGHWLATKDYEDAFQYASILKVVIESLPYVSNYVPESACIYSARTPLVLLFTHRKSLYFPDVKNSADDFHEYTSTCDYFLAMPMTSSNKQSIYYPIEIVKSDARYEVFPIADEKQGKNKIFLIKRI
ncbi:MAG TPA: hypothetical protein EYQ42_00545 [Thiotrichaceae bacterium]|jgi:hypothetical protein|nr:hypothetical protein [Thiotrichaceae bacterium]